MKNKENKSVARKTGTFGIFSILLNLILLFLLSFIGFEFWLCIKLYLFHDKFIKEKLLKTLSYDLELCSQHSVTIASYLTNKFSRIDQLLTFLNLQKLFENLILFVYVFEIIIIRVFLFIFILPFYFLILLLFAIDGLAQRDIRKFKGARESALVFHRLKPMSSYVFNFLFILFITLPFNLSPFLLLIGMTFLSGLFVNLTIKSFKKYL